MDFRLLGELYGELHDDNFCFFYRGQFSDHITSQLFNISESKFADIKSKNKIRKKVNFLMVECIQNIERHGIAEPEHDPTLGFFSLRSQGDHFFLTSCNIVQTNIIEKLQSNLDQVNELDPDELKNLYKAVLGKGELSEKGGAGLGIIEMARKSSGNLDYEFVKINESLSYFYLQLSLSTERELNLEGIPLKDSIRYHRMMLESDVHFIYSGLFTNETIKPIAHTLEQNVSLSSNKEKSRILFHVLIELMQNISKYAKTSEHGKEGIFTIRNADHSYEIHSANPVNRESMDRLSEIIDRVNSADMDELDYMYRSEMKKTNTEESSAGLGFIDIARTTQHKLEYMFDTIADERTYMIKVSV